MELSENFNVTLSNIQSIGMPAPILAAITVPSPVGVGTITNDDAATVSINSISQTKGMVEQQIMFTPLLFQTLRMRK